MPSDAHAPAISPADTPTPWRQSLVLAALLGLLGVFTACRAPGMKFTTLAGDRESRMQLADLKITLCPINPAAIQAQPHAGLQLDALKELLAAGPSPYRVGPQDALLVTVWDHPELNLLIGTARMDTGAPSPSPFALPSQPMPQQGGTTTTPSLVVDEDGCMYYPFVGRLPVAGLTVGEVRTRLTTALAKTLRDPQVDVKVVAFRSQKIYVDGEVRNPAVYTVTDVPFTLAEAANRAGGFLPTADLSRVVLSRGNRRWTLHFLDLTNEGNRIGQIYLKDGDSLHVSHRDEAPVYLMGELRNPRSLPLYHGRISLAQALSDAGGISSATADARTVYVLRQGAAAHEVKVFHLDAYNPVSMVLADRFALLPRDVVYVDAGPLVRWSRVVGLLAPTLTALTSTISTAYDVKYLTQ